MIEKASALGGDPPVHQLFGGDRTDHVLTVKYNSARCGETSEDEIDVDREPRQVADEQVDGCAALHGETVFHRDEGQDPDEKRNMAPIGSAKAVSLAPPDLSPSFRTHQPLRTMVPTCSPRSARSRSSGRSPLMIWNCFSCRALARRSIMTRSNGSVGRLRALSSDTVISLMNSALGLTFGSAS